MAPLMRDFSAAHVRKWKKLYRQSIKRTLRLPQFLPNEEIDKLSKQFGFRPNPILEAKSEQLWRFRKELKRNQCPLTQMQLLQIVDDLEHEEAGMRIKQSEIRSQFYRIKEQQ